jgi:glycosyltransferase involved in cell wall biosynthesis
VLQHLLRVFPEAPVYTSVYDPSRMPAEIREWTIRQTSLRYLPGVRRYSRLLLPLMPWAFQRLDLSEFDVVISASSAFSKNVTVSSGAVNVCYCHTPPRYLWDLADEYGRRVPARRAIAPLVRWLRDKDLEAAGRVDHFVANSRNVADRIARSYGRDSTVIYPPVDTDRIAPNGAAPEDFYLVVARLVPYKRVDLAVEACTRLGRSLLVVGRGPDRRRLAGLAGPTVRFLGELSDTQVADLYARSKAFLFPGIEDFGISVVESQAAGRPVVAFACGGATETVIDGETGVLFREQTVDALAAAMDRLDSLAILPAACRANAMRFDASIFRQRMTDIVTAAATIVDPLHH